LSPAALIGALHGKGSAAAENLQLARLDPRAIETASQAEEHGSLLDPVRIGDIVRTALAGGELSIPVVGGTFAIADGRLTFTPLIAPAQGADVTIRGGYDLGADALDLAFELAGAPAVDSATRERPRLTISFKGPVAAPRRGVDVGSLVGWLTARRVERETKRLEAAEQEAKRVQEREAEALRRAQERAAQERAAQERAAHERAQEEARKAAQKAAAQRAAEQAAAQRAAEQAAAASPPAAPGAEKAPELPPAIEIPPAPVTPARPRRPSPPRGASVRSPAPTALPPPLVITPLAPP
jgi:large subunit ribosomal protein L24